VAAAVIDLSSTDYYETITVRNRHVYFISDWLTLVYSAKNCQLDLHAANYRLENTISDEEWLYHQVKEHMQDEGRQTRVKAILKELFPLSPDDSRQKLPQSYIKDILDCDRATIFRDLKPFISNRLIKSARGYLPTPKLFQFKHWLRDRDPYLLEDPEAE
jgi:hypothetical protein